jgi:hypothetical protein
VALRQRPEDMPMSAAIVHSRMPHVRLFGGVRRTMPRITLQRTATGWGLFDERQLPVFEADGTGGRRACLRRALALGIVRLREGEEPHV